MATSKASSHLRRKYVGAKQKKLVKQEVPILEDKHTVHEEWVWEYRMGELMKTEQLLEGNLHSLFMVMMSLFYYEEQDRKYKRVSQASKKTWLTRTAWPH